MKRELAITGIALVVSILLSSPSIAQTKPPEAQPAPAATEAAATNDANARASLDEMTLDDAILFASSPEDRASLLMRCAGPPPRPLETATRLEPASEPAVVVSQ